MLLIFQYTSSEIYIKFKFKYKFKILTVLVSVSKLVVNSTCRINNGEEAPEVLLLPTFPTCFVSTHMSESKF